MLLDGFVMAWIFCSAEEVLRPQAGEIIFTPSPTSLRVCRAIVSGSPDSSRKVLRFPMVVSWGNSSLRRRRLTKASVLMASLCSAGRDGLTAFISPQIWRITGTPAA